MLQQQLHINIIINNSSLKISLSKIRTVLHLSLLLNKSKQTSIFLEIPRFCFHPRLPIAGNCRMCLIELFKAPKLVVACTTRVQEGMILFTNSVLVKKAREYLLEFFLANHPLDCPICDQGGECDLQNQLEVFGLDHTRYTENIKKVAKVVNIGVVSFQMTRCIQCTRCVRFLTSVASNFDLGIIARGGKMKISKYLNTYLYNEFLSNIVDLCPVGSLQSNIYFRFLNLKSKHVVNYLFFFFCGALTTASSAYRTRSWELYSKYTIDILDNIGADIRVDLKGTDIIRILPRLNIAVNDHWITELTRYSFNGLKIQRLLLPYYKTSKNKHTATTWSFILNLYSKYIFVCTTILKKKLNWEGIAGNLIDSKTAISFKRFLQVKGSSNIESRAYQNQELVLDFVDMFSLKTTVFKESGIIFLIGVNLRLEVPFYHLKMKQKKNLILFLCGAGVAYFSNYVSNNIQSIVLSSTIKAFIKILEGRSVMSHYFVQLFSKKQNSLLFLLGASVTQRKDILHILNIINFFGVFINNQCHWKQQIYINIIQPHIGRITANTLNLGFSRSALQNNNSLSLKYQFKFFKKKVNILFNQGTEDFKNLNVLRDNTLQIFLGHTAIMTNIADFLLPTCTFFEKETLYLNIENVLRESKLVMAPYLNMNVIADWQIFFLFLKKQKLFLNVIRKKKKLRFVSIFNKFKLLQHKFIFENFFFHWLLFFEFALINFSFKCNFFNFFLYCLKKEYSLQKLYVNIFLLQQNIKKLLGNYYYQKYIYLAVFTKTLFNTLTIDTTLITQLLTHSRLFRIQNQYSSKALSYLHINSLYSKIKSYLINYPFILKYRTYFISNIISQNTIDMTKIKYNLQQRYTNYVF